MELDSNQIAALLPHRYPFALVDRITDYEPGAWARGIKCVSVNEPFFCGHFPQKHVMPGVLILEALAQVGAVAARFKRRVAPGDVLELECAMVKRKGPVGIGAARATVDGQVAAVAELTFVLTDQ